MTAPALPSRLERLARQSLYLISTLQPGDSTDRELLALTQAVEGGVGLIQLRVKGATTAGRQAWLSRCRDALPDDVLLIINDDLAALFDASGRPVADGLHLGRGDAAELAAAARAGDTSGTHSADEAENLAGLALARERLGPELLLGSSTRTLVELGHLLAAGADHAGFGAMSPSVTKRDTQPADPAELRRCIVARPSVPLFAIGGLSPHNLGLVTDTGCRRAAVGAAILRADDPAAAAAACFAALTAPA